MRLKVSELSKIFFNGGVEVQALKNCSFSANEGEQIAVTGSSGSGKSTLLHLLGGLQRASSGQILYDETDFTALSQSKCDSFRLKNIGVVFQEFNLIPEMTAYENILLPLMLLKKHPDKTYANELIDRLDLSECFLSSINADSNREQLLRGHWLRTRNCCFVMSQQVI